jgi:hypothetical protein
MVGRELAAGAAEPRRGHQMPVVACLSSIAPHRARTASASTTRL